MLRKGCQTENHCFCQCGCEPELHIEANLGSSIEEEEEDDAFQEGCIWPGAEKDVDLNFHVSVDNELATCGISGIDELCDVHEVGSSEGEEEEDECEAEPLLSFTTVYLAYETAKSFLMYHINEHDRIF
jgi:hypothetical protein